MVNDNVKTSGSKQSGAKEADMKRHSDQTPGKHESSGPAEHGVVRDERGQEQPTDKRRAQEVNRRDEGGDPPGHKA